MSGAQVLEHLVDVGGAVWRASWQASVLAGLVVAVQLVFGRRIPARWRHAMWMLVLVRLALPVAPSSPLSVFNLAPGKAPAAQPATVAMVEFDRATIAWTTPDEHETLGAAVPPLAASRIDDRLSATPQAAQRASTALNPSTKPWRLFLAALWALGALLLALRIARATWRVSRTLRRLDPVGDAAVHDVLCATAAELGVRRIPLLLAGEGLFSPALVGCVRPRLLVPRDLLDRFDAAELRLIFLHELAHLKRRDVATNWAATLLAVLHWPNPIAWLAVWRLRLERELACDELVMSRTSDSDRRAYGHTIVKLLETLSRAPGAGAARHALPAGGVGILEGKAQMKRRIVMIAQFARSSRAWTVVAALIVVALGAVALTDAVVQAEEPVKPATRPAAGAQKRIKMADGTFVPTNGPDDLEQGTIVINGDVVPTDNYRTRPATPEHYEALFRLQALRAAQDAASVGPNHPESVARAKEIKALEEWIAARAKAQAPSTQPTKVKPGDLVAVSIMDLVGPGIETVRTARVDGDGTINLPYVGSVAAAGLTRAELEKAASTAFNEKGVVQNTVVVVSFPERGESHQLAKSRDAAAIMMTPSPMAPQPGSFAPGMEDPAMMAPAAPAAAAAAAAAPVEDPAAKAILSRRIPEAKFDNVPLGDVIDFLRQVTDSNIFVNWRSLETVGVDRAVPVSMQLRDVAFENVLKIVLRDVGEGLAYQVENGVITIDVAAHQPKAAKLITKAYDVRDLMAAAPAPAAVFALPGAADAMEGGGPISGSMVELTRTIYETVAPESWRTAGGRGSLSTYGSKIIVTADEEVHREVANLLEMLREKPAAAATKPAAAAGATLQIR